MNTKAYQEIVVDKTLFRAYDIRGVVDTHFNENAYYSIGRALACRLVELGRDRIFIAKDGRLSSPSLAQALVQGLLNSGIDVVDLGIVPSPVMYYATHSQDLDCGLMVTGSHNPANYNGIKMVLAGKTLVQDDIEQLYTLVKTGKFRDGKGNYSNYDILPAYKARVLEKIALKRRLKVVVDCGNGVGGGLIPEVISRLGCEVIPLFCEVDGHFPNHHPDPSIEENLQDLKAMIAETEADLGLAFDGDADRLGLVTNTGRVIWPDRLMMYYARNLLKKRPGETIVFDIKCSAHLRKVIEDAGGRAMMCPTGHSIVKGIMKSEKAILAGEMSGHLFFQDDWYGFDDALYSACRLLEWVAQSPETVETQFASIPDSVNTPEIKIALDDALKFAFMQRFCDEADFKDAKAITIDGLRVEFAKGWGLVRASNTTPCLVLRFEADDESELKAIMQRFKIELLKINPTLSIPF